MRVLIVGAGGHGQVVADILLRMRDSGADVNPIGYVDDDSDRVGRRFLSLPVRGTTAELATIPHEGVVVAIGDNRVRQRLFEELQSSAERLITASHPQAVIAPDVSIGAGTMICANVVVNPGSEIGPNVILNTACTVDHHNKIGAHAHVAPGAHLGGEVGVGEGSLIGIGSTILPRCHVGDWSVVSAGALVHRSLPDGVTAAGAPARIIKRKEHVE